MFLLHIVIVAWAFVCCCNFILAAGRRNENSNYYKLKREKEEELENIQHKIPLIDIIFTDGTSRICTGAIIHEYVVISAGHCFLPARARNHPREVVAELTGSFVVIGNKKKFESGYEQYLPIERVLTHPNMKGWSCDLALIHTFASMAADKVGAVMNLAGEKTSTSIEPNVTIFSWGRIIESPPTDDFTTESLCCLGEKVCFSEEQAKCDKHKEQLEHKGYTDEHSYLVTQIYEATIKEVHGTTAPIYIRGKDQNRNDNRFIMRKGVEQVETTVSGSRYLTSSEIVKQLDRAAETQVRAAAEEADYSTDILRRFLPEGQPSMDGKQQKHDGAPKPGNWRRNVGAKAGNKLTLETFGFLNSATCKKMLLRAQPNMQIDGDEIVCYASDDHYVTEEDSGAPVVRLGQLIAITVGGIKSEGDHVAVGMKLSYFCPWINENLPSGEDMLDCWAQTQNRPEGNDSNVDLTHKNYRLHA